MMGFDVVSGAGTGVLLADGAMGTQIQSAGLPAVLCPEEYNISHPEVIERIHRSYVEAGSRLILTNTFGCSGFKLRRAGVGGGQMEELIAAACRVALRAAGDDAAVAGDIGPSGEVMEPFGDTPAADLRSDFARQARALADHGADLIIIETVMDLNEMRLAVETVRETTTLAVIASMAFGESGRTTFGNSVEECGRALAELGVSVLGANCMMGIEHYPAIVRAYRSVSELPVMAQPNAGQPETREGKVVYRETPETMAARLPALVDAGASIIGGCCGTSPETIRRFREVLAGTGRGG